LHKLVYFHDVFGIVQKVAFSLSLVDFLNVIVYLFQLLVAFLDKNIFMVLVLSFLEEIAFLLDRLNYLRVWNSDSCLHLHLIENILEILDTLVDGHQLENLLIVRPFVLVSNVPHLFNTLGYFLDFLKSELLKLDAFNFTHCFIELLI